MPDDRNDQNGIIAQLLEWAKGQPFNNVMLAAIFGSIVWLGYFALNTAIPTVLKQIQDGYERIEDQHRQERDEQIRVYDKWFERFDRGERNKAIGPTAMSYGTAMRGAHAEMAASQQHHQKADQ